MDTPVNKRVAWSIFAGRKNSGAGRRIFRPTLFAAAVLFLGNPAVTGETIWFGGTQRALPISLAAPKEDGLNSLWGVNNRGDNVWDFNLGTDISVWQETNATSFQSLGPRFGVATRFQFNSPSFDLWAADLQGGGVYGIRRGRMAFEAYFYHESSHLGDEILARGERARIDYNVNGLRLTVSWEPESALPCTWFKDQGLATG